MRQRKTEEELLLFIERKAECEYMHCVNIRAVKVNALIDAINLAAINALKYFNAINATLFTSGVRCPLTRNRHVPT